MHYLLSAILSTSLIAFKLTANASDLANTQIDTKILNSLHQSIAAHEKATSYHQWLNSQLHPKNVLKKLSTYNQKQVCQTLEQVTPNNLVIFYNAILDSKTLPCKNKYIEKIDQFLSKQANKIAPSAYFNLRPLPLGPSREQYIDTTNGPIFITGDLGYKEVALTFDDGPHSVLTPQLLNILKEENVQVTFFSVGQNVKNHPQIVRNIIADHHSLGNHSWNHPDMKKLNMSKAIDQITSTYEQINHEINFFIPFFRYPYGSYTQDLKKYLKQNNISAFFWNTDTLDWKYKDPEFLIQYAWSEFEKNQGGIVLFHDVQPQTIAILPEFIRRLKANGYKPVVFRTDQESL